MQHSSMKLLLVTILSVAWYSRGVVANKVIVTDFNVNIVNSDIIESWEYDLADNRVGSNINIKKNCPGPMQADVRVYKGDDLVNNVKQKLDKPMEDMKSYGICESVDCQDLDDEACSIAQGEQVAKGCDISGWFSDMDRGKYKTVCDFILDNEVITTLTLDVTVESDQ